MTRRTSHILPLFCGLLGCLLMGGSDYLMIWGDTAATGALPWLTEGVAAIPPGRNALATALSFPAVILYAVALLHLRHLFREEPHRRSWVGLTTLGMTPWLCLHLFYTMILFLFGYLRRTGSPEAAHRICEALFSQFSWVVPVAEVLMVLPFLYFAFLVAAGRSTLPRILALNNPLLIFAVLKGLTLLLPDSPFRLACTNGLMSEAMAVWFLLLLIFA